MEFRVDTTGKTWWWGYKHVNDILQAKRYYGPDDLAEAKQSEFVVKVVGPFPAQDRKEAIQIVARMTS